MPRSDLNASVRGLVAALSGLVTAVGEAARARPVVEAVPLRVKGQRC